MKIKVMNDSLSYKFFLKNISTSLIVLKIAGFEGWIVAPLSLKLLLIDVCFILFTVLYISPRLHYIYGLLANRTVIICGFRWWYDAKFLVPFKQTSKIVSHKNKTHILNNINNIYLLLNFYLFKIVLWTVIFSYK